MWKNGAVTTIKNQQFEFLLPTKKPANMSEKDWERLKQLVRQRKQSNAQKQGKARLDDE